MKARLTKLFTLLTILLFGVGSVWADTELCSATLNGITSNSNTTGIAQTGCTMKWNSVTYSGSDVITIGTVNFYKFSGSSSYVQLVLTSGSFQAGDELTVTLCSNAGSGKTKSVQYSLHSDSGNKSEAQNVGSASPTDVAYTLVAADIESDGSIKIFRGGNTNIRFGSFSVTRSGGGSSDPVSSVEVTGATTGYATVPVALTATPDETATGYKWFVDGVEQDGKTSATFNFEAATPGTYSIVAKARNDYNATDEWIASSAHTVTISKLCGELVKLVVTGGSAGTVSGILTGTKDVNVSTGSSSESDYDEKHGYKLGGNGKYAGITGLSKPLRAGDVATIFVTTVSAKLQLFSDKGTTLIGEMDGGVVQGENEIVLNSSATGATAIYLYRTSTAGSDMNPFVHSLSVSRSCTESDDCSISDVTINGESVTPVGKVYSYEVAAASALTEVAVTYAIHPLATGTPTSGFTVAVPTAGDPANTQTITVTAEDGTHSDTYTISVSKATVASDVVTLDALAVTGYTLSPTFDAATLAYTITKDYGTADPTTDKVTYTKSEDAQKVEVNYDGTNHKFVVTVTAEDNTTTQDYEITINEAEAPKSLSRVLFSNGFDAFIDNTNHTVKAFYLAGTAAPTATTITAGTGTAGTLSEGKIRVTGADDSYVDYIVTLAEVTPNTTTVAEDAAAGEFAGDEAWVKNGLLVYGNAAGYSAGDKWYVNRRLTKSGDAADDQRVIAGWVRSYFFVGNAKKFIMTVGGNNAVKYAIDGGDQVANASGTLEIALTKGNHMIEVVSNQSSGDCRLSAPKLVELPASHTVTYMPGDGEGALVVDDDAIEVADCPNTFTAPEGKIFNGWKDGDNNDVEVGAAVTTDMALTAQWINHYAVTFNMNGHGDAIDPQDIKHGEKATKPADPVVMGFDFGGWFTDAACTAGNEFDFNTAITEAKELFAKWTEFDGCALLVPATSGDALTVGAMVDLQAGSVGGSIKVANLGAEGSISYNANGLLLSNGGKDSILVTLNNELKNGSVIKVRLMANGGTKDNGRGLNLLNAARVKKALLGWQANEEVTSGDIREFTYTVVESDGFAGTNVFTLQRQNSVFLQSIKVEECGAAITYHNLTSEVNIAGKGTVTLGASSVREGYTTTATYSEIDPLYEFVNWTVSGAGASIADASANPATITMGTEDAVVTLNLRLIPVKFTVEYYDGATLMGSEQVAVNENPTASEIVTAKRHYTFLGWSDTDGGDVVALNTITRTEAGTVKLYAKYEAVVCPTSGTIFSMEFDETKKPGETVTIAKDASIDLAEYATISGGNAMIINGETSGKDAISTDGEFLLKATKEVMKIELNCVLQEGDIIRIPDNSAKLVISTSNAKTGTYQAFADKNTHEFAVTAAWAGVDDIYVLYDGSSLKFTKVYVIRPAKYDVSFNMMGHGSAIADLEDVVEGSKITAPSPAPTDADYSFAGWYKENTLENEWDFDVDVVTDNITLYAKWLDKSDATLKSLKYGSTEIELQAGVYTYAVELPSLTTSVPALTAETSNPNASALITNDDAFDGEGNASSTVEVTPEKEGAAHQTYTVNFTKLPSMPLLDVDNSIVWDFDNAGTQNNAFTDEVLANFPGVTNDATFSAQTLKATGAKIKDGYLQGTPILFHATKAGLLRVEFANTGGSARPYRYLVVNGVRTAYKSNNTAHVTTAWIEVPAGDVTIEGECVEDANGACTSNNLNFYKIEFYALGHSRDVTPGNLGTLCLPNACIARGVDVYELVGKEATYGKIVFADLEPDDLLVAGQAYIFQVNEATARFYYAPGEPVDAPLNNTALKGNLGSTITFQPNSPEAENVYFVKDHALWSAKETGVNIGQYRAYLQMDDVSNVTNPSPAPGRRYIMLGTNGTNVATGIDDVQDDVRSTKMLIDGRLFILRGEKIYDATGRLVK